MTAKVHRKCRFYNKFICQCSLTRAKVDPWGDACPSYDLDDKFLLKVPR
jgi:hypothetical protein